MRTPRWWAFSLAVLLSCGVVNAQPDSLPDTTVHAPVPWTFGGWIAGAQHQLIKTRLGRIHDRSLYIVSFRAQRRLREDGPVAIDYTADFQPMVIATANREYTTRLLCTPGFPCFYPPGTRVYVPSRHTAYGVGVAPAGLRVRVRVFGPCQMALGVSGGAMYFDRKVPDPGEERFNFTADANAALSLQTRVGGMSAGMRLHHISNANTGRVNPGLNSFLVFLGYDQSL